jgi:HTH-type transcriptional regulator / antitoxin HigA
MNLQPIHTEVDYRAALREVSELVDLDPQRLTPEGHHLETLGLMVQAYEAKQVNLSLHCWRVGLV